MAKSENSPTPGLILRAGIVVVISPPPPQFLILRRTVSSRFIRCQFPQNVNHDNSTLPPNPSYLNDTMLVNSTDASIVKDMANRPAGYLTLFSPMGLGRAIGPAWRVNPNIPILINENVWR